MSRIHWVDRGTGTPKDRDEVNRRDVYECDGWVCVLEEIGAPAIFKLIRKAAAFGKGRRRDQQKRNEKKIDILFLKNLRVLLNFWVKHVHILVIPQRTPAGCFWKFLRCEQSTCNIGTYTDIRLQQAGFAQNPACAASSFSIPSRCEASNLAIPLNCASDRGNCHSLALVACTPQLCNRRALGARAKCLRGASHFLI